MAEVDLLIAVYEANRFSTVFAYTDSLGAGVPHDPLLWPVVKMATAIPLGLNIGDETFQYRAEVDAAVSLAWRAILEKTRKREGLVQVRHGQNFLHETEVGKRQGCYYFQGKGSGRNLGVLYNGTHVLSDRPQEPAPRTAIFVGYELSGAMETEALGRAFELVGRRHVDSVAEEIKRMAYLMRGAGFHTA